MRNVGGDVKCLAIFMPQNDTGGSNVDGEIVDRLGYESCVIAVNFGATSGSPSTTSIAGTLVHGDAADLSDEAVFATPAVLVDPTAAGGDIQETSVDLRAAKRYIRYRQTTTFTAGSSPAVDLSATVVLGEAEILPAV